jgi:multiple sugar transport system ATP-binding protein
MGMGDRIVVMYEGKVRQIGRPDAVYENPADTFVATFLGSPPMNLIPRDDVLVGFRPETVLPAEALPDHLDGHRRFTMKVHRIEYLSGDRHLHGLVTGLGEPTPAIIRLPATVFTPIEADNDYEFVLPDTKLKYFDRETEQATQPVPA